MSSLRETFNNQYQRDRFIVRVLRHLAPGLKILDAGAGSQRYRQYCEHLIYVAQDSCQVSMDKQVGLAALKKKYEYGKTDIACDITAIPVAEGEFDVVLCTEVFEHLPDPIAALKELVRVLRPGGILILTVPSNCLRHFDPHFYYSGFSDHFIKHWFENVGLQLRELERVGNYWSWMMVEVARSIRHAPASVFLLAPALIYFFLRSKIRDPVADATLCMGYHAVGKKIPLR